VPAPTPSCSVTVHGVVLARVERRHIRYAVIVEVGDNVIAADRFGGRDTGRYHGRAAGEDESGE